MKSALRRVTSPTRPAVDGSRLRCRAHSSFAATIANVARVIADWMPTTHCRVRSSAFVVSGSRSARVKACAATAPAMASAWSRSTPTGSRARAAAADPRPARALHGAGGAGRPVHRPVPAAAAALDRHVQLLAHRELRADRRLEPGQLRVGARRVDLPQVPAALARHGGRSLSRVPPLRLAVRVPDRQARRALPAGPGAPHRGAVPDRYPPADHRHAADPGTDRAPQHGADDAGPGSRRGADVHQPRQRDRPCLPVDPVHAAGHCRS